MSKVYRFNEQQLQAIIAFQESNAIEQEWDHDSLNDTLEAWNFLLGQESLTHDVILKTHLKLMSTRQTIPWNLKGVYRRGDIYIANRKGTDPQHLKSQMNDWIFRQNELIRLSHEEYTKNNEPLGAFQDGWAKSVMQEHIAYEIIHPFADGNGRTGRLFLNWTRVQMGLPILVIWERTKCTEYYPIFKDAENEL